jgi:hypothetical protein
MNCFSQIKQPIDSIEVLKKSDWKTGKSWFGDKVVSLTPIEKLIHIDTPELSKKEKAEQLLQSYQKLSNQGERIHFNTLGQLDYSYSLSCPVGELIYDIKAFKIIGNKIFVEYRKYLWDSKNSEYQKANYLIDKWTSNEIIIILTNN